MYYFMKNSSLRLTEAGNRINQSFCGRHYKTVLHTPSYFLNAYKYNYIKPLIAGVSERAEEYPFSTLSGIMGKTQAVIPLAEDCTFFSDISGTLQWLNTMPCTKKLDAVRWGLKRPTFKSKKCRITRRPILKKNETL